MIDIAPITLCKNPGCGKPVLHVPGHRRRQYCNDTCKQTAYRKRKEQQTNDVTIVDESTLQRIAELEQEIQRLQERLDLETRFRLDVEVRHFKNWLRRYAQTHDTDFYKRFLADSRLPQHASRSIYAAKIRLYHYSEEDTYLFEDAWKDMLVQP